MSLEIRTIRDIDGDADVLEGRQVGLQAVSTQPVELEPAPEPWILNKAGFIWGTRRVPCWNCGFPVMQTGLFVELKRHGRFSCRVIGWSVADDELCLFSPPFRDMLYTEYFIQPCYSHAMGRTYTAILCPNCGQIQGDNFVYGNYQGRGGVFANPVDTSTLIVNPLPLPSTGLTSDECNGLFGLFTLEVDPRRIQFGHPFQLPDNADPWT